MNSGNVSSIGNGGAIEGEEEGEDNSDDNEYAMQLMIDG